MVPSRRRALGGVAAVLAALAGCNGSTDAQPRAGKETEPPPLVGDERGPSPPSDDESDGVDRRERIVRDPPTVKLRRTRLQEPLVELPDFGSELSPAERELRETVRRGFVTTSEAASLVHIDGGEGAETARRFLAATDFDREFVYLTRTGVPQCYEQVLCFVTLTPTELETTYAEVYRDYDVACSADEYDRIIRLVRLEGSVDTGQIESGGVHVRRGGCPIPQTRDDDAAGNRNSTSSTNHARRDAPTFEPSAHHRGRDR